MNLKPFRYMEPETLEEAVEVLAVCSEEDPRVIAGGTVLVPLMKMRMLQPQLLVGLDRIEELQGIVDQPDGVRIGAMTTHRDVATSDAIRRRAPLLAEASGRVASPTIRSMGTLGGNVCYGESASDPPPALLVLDARLRLYSAEGERSVPAREFFIGLYETALREQEVLTAVEIPRQPPGAWTYVKWTPRAREDKPLVGLAALVELEDGVCRTLRIAVSGVGGCPVLLARTAALLEGREVSDATIAEVAEFASTEVDPLDDAQATARYRSDMLRVWVGRVLRRLCRPEEGL